MPTKTEIVVDRDGYSYVDELGDNLGVSLDRRGYIPIGTFVGADFIGCHLDFDAVEHLRDALSEWLELENDRPVR